MLFRERRLLFLEELAKSTTDLRYFDGVLLACVKDVCFAGTHDLRDPRQPLEG
jgi:hypothetical protein